MNFKSCLIVLLFVTFATNARSEVSAVTHILTSLGSSKETVVDKTIKSLGIERGIRGGFEKFQVLQPSQDSNLYIIALSWNPPDGYLLLLNSEGRVLSKMKTGLIKSISLSELTRGERGDLIVIDCITDYGSSYNKDMYRIYSIKGDELHMIWEGISSLSDIYVQNNEITGLLKLISSGDSTYLHYYFTTKRYAYDKMKNKWSIDDTGADTEDYIYNNGHFISFKPCPKTNMGN